MEYAQLVLVTGSVIVLTMLIKTLLDRSVFPSLIGFLLLGILLRSAEAQGNFLPEGSEHVLSYMGQLGLVTLLFSIGMKSDITNLLGQLRNASLAWVSNIIIAALFGYLTAFYLLHLGLATSLIIAVAFTATSVGVSVKVWDDKGALKSSKGALLLDLAELDDVTAVVLMALLFAVVPSLQAGGEAPFLALLFKTSGFFILKMAGFALFCYLFARFLEKPATNFFQRYESLPDSTLTIVGIGLVIASIAEILGFSLAIGAFFAGLVFCRDPKMVSVERSFAPIYDLFSPFFFISIGYDFAPGTFTTALGLAVLLASMAIISKLLANALPIYFLSDGLTASLIGVSMVPRAEITMVIMQKGLQLGEWAVSSHVYAAMVLVSAITCFLSPVLVNSMLNKWPQDGG